MRSFLQRKDIFLSYAHMNIEFARRIKVKCIVRVSKIFSFNSKH